MDIHVVDHPLARARMTTLRDVRTGPAEFRAALRELTMMLVYEAARDLPVLGVEITTPMASTIGTRLKAAPLLVPVLRAGLGMVGQAQELLPEAQVGLVGLARDEQTLQPVQYLQSLPDDLSHRPVYVLDPMLATGGSMCHTVELLMARGATELTAVCVVSAPEGVAALEASGAPVRLVTAVIDERLNEAGMIVPGLGDAGDRQFGPR